MNGGGGAPRGRGPLRARTRAVWSVVLLGGLLLATAAPTWVSTTVSTALTARVPVEVAGTSASPAVGAAALVVVAAGVALAIAGRVARWVALVVVALAGALAAASALGLLLDPVPAATSGASAAEGVTDLTSPVAVSVWPWATAVLGALVVVAAVLVAVGGPGWATTSGRHERVMPATRQQAAAADHGSEHTDEGAVSAEPPGDGGVERRDEDTAQHDPHDAWDALTRGTDPSEDR